MARAGGGCTDGWGAQPRASGWGDACPKMGYNPSKTVASVLLGREGMKNKNLVPLPQHQQDPSLSSRPAHEEVREGAAGLRPGLPGSASEWRAGSHRKVLPQKPLLRPPVFPANQDACPLGWGRSSLAVTACSNSSLNRACVMC